MRVSETGFLTTLIVFCKVMKILAAKVDCKSPESVHIWGNHDTMATDTYGQRIISNVMVGSGSVAMDYSLDDLDIQSVIF